MVSFCLKACVSSKTPKEKSSCHSLPVHFKVGPGTSSPTQKYLKHRLLSWFLVTILLQVSFGVCARRPPAHGTLSSFYFCSQFPGPGWQLLAGQLMTQLMTDMPLTRRGVQGLQPLTGLSRGWGMDF